MVAVAIVGVLAGIAIPEYHQTVLRSRRMEMAVQLDGVIAAESAYRAEWASFTSCGLAPAQLPGRTPVAFPSAADGAADWALMGWIPDGLVRGQYEAIAVAVQGELTRFSAVGYMDLDEDGNLASYRATESVRPALVTPNTVY